MKKNLLLLMLFLRVATFGQFVEGFENGIPSNWSIINGGDANGWISNVPVAPVTAHSGTKVARLDYSAVAHDDYLITKQFLVTANVSNRISFWYRHLQDEFPEPFNIMVSTAGATASDFINLVPDLIVPNETWQNISFDLDSYQGQNIFIAFRSVTTEKYQLYIDDVLVDGVPVSVPDCASGLTAVPNINCGNLTTKLSWLLDANATGYRLSIGTTIGGNDIVDNLNIGYVDIYTAIDQIPGTAYFWRIVPYNLVGQATNCLEENYTTLPNACYCTPAPQLGVDGYGITNFTMGSINQSGQNVILYNNFSNLSTNGMQGNSVPFSIKMETGYPYYMNVWVDWNNDFDFDDALENTFAGTCSAVVPNFVTGSVAVPANAILGPHRIRVGGQFLSPVTPCFNGQSFACFEDYTLNVTQNPLSNNGFGLSKFNYFPNPVVDVLNIQSESELSNVEIFNVLGQKVSAKLVFDNRIDISNLTSGTYLIKFEIENESQIIKVLKR